MEKVVYILGAGFSAPLGFPVMSNFIEKSKDMYFENPDKYKSFMEIFKLIQEISYVKNFYDADLLNIEEILSIIETKQYVSDSIRSESFVDYISEVIEYYTPDNSPYNYDLAMNKWHNFIFWSDDNLSLYGTFIASIQNLKFFQEGDYGQRHIHCERRSDIKTLYSIITLNYDMIFENCCDYISANFKNHSASFNKEYDKDKDLWTEPSIAKLHGSIDEHNIIPPTWNKTITDKKIKDAWKIAFNILKEANQIRIIGYSLPITDSYVKYLFKSAISKDPHLNNLKKIDVLCLDDKDGSVRKRYEEFIHFSNFRFINGNFSDFLNDYDNNGVSLNHGTNTATWNNLERFHETYFKDNFEF